MKVSDYYPNDVLAPDGTRRTETRLNQAFESGGTQDGSRDLHDGRDFSLSNIRTAIREVALGDMSLEEAKSVRHSCAGDRG